MWYTHIIPTSRMRFCEILPLLVTWPYHRTFRYFTLDPAARLEEDLVYLDRANGAAELARTINHWISSKDHEWDFVSNASGLAAIATLSIFSWTDIGSSYWLATAFLYWSLSLSLWAVIVTAQQKSVTRTLIVFREDSPEQLRLKLRVILRIPDIDLWKPQKSRRKTFAELNMLYVWQCPLMLMSYGWMTLLLGITLHVCTPLIDGAGRDPRKVAIFYLATAIFLALNFIWSSAWSFWKPKTANEDLEKATFRRSSVDYSLPSTRSGTIWIPENRTAMMEETKDKFPGAPPLGLVQSKTM